MLEILAKLPAYIAAVLKPMFDLFAEAVGIIGVLALTIGVIKALYLYARGKNLWKTRVVLVEHILLGLDFLIVRDIIQSITLKTTMLWADLGALVLMVAVRVIFSFFTSKEMEELLEERQK